jgi:hypothetical protein
VIKKLFIAILFSFFALQMNAQMVAVKSDLVKLGAMIPNLGVELVVGNKTTFGVDLMGAQDTWWSDYSRMMAISPNIKYWFSGRPMTRQFVGLSAHLANYNLYIGKERFQGNSAAMGLIGGHVFNLSSHWNLEFCGGLSLMGYRQKHYYSGDSYNNGYFEKANDWGVMLFPKLELSVSYIIN